MDISRRGLAARFLGALPFVRLGSGSAMAGNPYLWSTTALNNQAIDPDIAWQEGQLPGTVNNSARGMMAAHAGFLKDNNGTLTTGGSANAHTVTSNVPFSNTPFSGVRLVLKAGFTNTGAATLNLTPSGGSAWGAKAIKVTSPIGAIDPGAGAIRKDGLYLFVYDTAANAGAGAWMLLNPSRRSAVGGGITIYVATTGSDTTNDGLTVGAPFLTIQKAIDTILQNLDDSSGGPTIQLADGTYSAGGTILSPPIGSSTWLTIQGNASTPGNVIINATGAPCFSILDYGAATIKDMRLQAASGSVQGINAKAFALIDFSNIEFGNCGAGGTHIFMNENCVISAVGNYKITGDAALHCDIQKSSVFDMSSITVNIAAARAFTIFASASDSSTIRGQSVSFTGTGATTSTGRRALCVNSSVSGAASFPGNTAVLAYYDPVGGTFNLSPAGTAAATIAATGTSIIGTNTNDSANAGWVGEIIESEILLAGQVALTTNVAKDVTNISLTAGDWDVWGNVAFTVSVASTSLSGAINTTTNTLPTIPGKGAFMQVNDVSSTVSPVLPVGQRRISIASTTTVYLVSKATFGSGTVSAFGYIGARRAR